MLYKQIIFTCISFLLIIFAVPQKISLLGIVTSNIGYALFLIAIAELSKKNRFINSKEENNEVITQEKRLYLS